ncbi:hypothetical protein PHYSODRAFT_529541 [Phytophthora sojae]|uniref:Crinkler effector protein N-terminal domain-containing protein n=1 Tax=Phytophthora sojae (strain P6497) TaxID=1094619 RepID=G5ABC1_PHYSP|nr:hypothetical protein PHYSODRAFT_529541 [Phytophthora sojae]EGZ07266.1 hypothetical protein PHYSODRAFT_529541 [Phytophthora sojae]|eukprot:XP_009536832.1 hypothetical protein PHYSODRAFT_529541 [Phytophthora sojae]
MVKLVCAIVGVAGSAFPVDIDASQLVGDLKKAIAEDQKYDFAASKLQLSLAKTADGAWLPDDDQAALDLEDGKVHEDIQALIDGEKMKATWTIEDVLTANNMTKRKGRAPKSRQIHVLVVVPEGAFGSASETSKMDQLVEKVDKIYEQTVLGKRKYVHSEVTSTQGRQLLNDLDIRVEFVRTVPFDAGEGSSNGEEVVLTEEQQRKRYRRYVEHNIGAVLKEKQLCVIGVERGTNILTVKVPGREIELAGRTDLLILSDLVEMRPTEVQYLPGVKMLIEVKRDVKASNDFQALSELIALDLLVDDPVMALLTDLKGEWIFFWVAEKINSSARIHKAAINKPGEAFEVIRALLVQPPTAPADTDTTEIKLPCFQSPVKRLKLRKALPPIGEGGDNGGIRESIERYYDIASMLGPDIEMARAVARQVTRSIPTFSYFS